MKKAHRAIEKQAAAVRDFVRNRNAAPTSAHAAKNALPRADRGRSEADGCQREQEEVDCLCVWVQRSREAISGGCWLKVPNTSSAAMPSARKEAVTIRIRSHVWRRLRW